MKGFYKILNLLILLILSIQNAKQDGNYFPKIYKIPKNKDRTHKLKNLGRKLDERALNIYFDLFNFNYTFPNDTLGADSKDIFINAMRNAEAKLRKIITIDVYIEGFAIKNEYHSEWNIQYWNDTMYNVSSLKLDKYNFFIFFNFLTSIHSEASSRIVISPDRPTCGVISINSEKIKSKLSIDYLTTLMLHHFIHLLGFHIDNYDSGEVPIFTGLIQEDGEGTYYISSNLNPILYEYISAYFNCPGFEDDIELEIDDDNNIHWPKRYFLGEIMTEFDYPEEQVLSGFTLAFFEDLGYLHVIKSYTGGLMRFGKYKGCSFLREKCGDNLDNEGHQKVFANEFYLPKEIIALPDSFEPSCSSGRLSKTVHKLYETSEMKNEDHQFYSNYIVGKDKTKYCPISEYDTSSRTNTYIGLCSGESQDAFLESKIGEFYSDKSFCVLSSLIKEADESYLKLRAVCYEMICSSLSLTIRIWDNYIVCPKEGGRIEAENFKGYILCPDYNLICTGTEMCNSMFDCIDKESEEKENTFDYSDYNEETGILTTQNSYVYSTQEVNYGWELSEGGTCPQFCMQCVSNKICIKCAPHYKKEEDGKKCLK